MNFGQIIERSLKLVRNHTVLWKLGLLALFTEGITGGFMSLPPTPGSSTNPAEEAEMMQLFERGMDWVRANQSLTAFIVAFLILLVLFGWYASLRAKAGLITAVVDLESDRKPGRFLNEYRRGAPFAWKLIGLYVTFGLLLSIVLGLPSAIIAGVAASLGEGVQLGLFLLMIPVLLVVGLYANFITKIAERAVVVGGQRVWSALGYAHQVLFGRPGHSALSALVDLGIQILFGMLILAVIVIGIGLAALLALLLSAVLPSTILAAVFGAVVLLFVAGFFLLGGWFSAFTTSYWTLVYRAINYINSQKGT